MAMECIQEFLTHENCLWRRESLNATGASLDNVPVPFTLRNFVRTFSLSKSFVNTLSIFIFANVLVSRSDWEDECITSLALEILHWVPTPTPSDVSRIKIRKWNSPPKLSGRMKITAASSQHKFHKSMEGDYKGDVKDGKRHGWGKIKWAQGGEYEGEWQQDHLHGIGKQKFLDGRVYEGRYEKDKMHGRGTMTKPDGQKYEGEWQDGKMHGRGTLNFADGTIYEGEWKYCKMHGRGTMTKPDGQKYEGQWQDCKKHGRGTENLVDGTIYEGQWKDWKPTRGTITLPNGKKYELDTLDT